MQKNDLIRARHMLEAAQEACALTHHKTRSDLDFDRKLVLAVIKSIEIIGEASARITEETKMDFSQIPWERIVSMRNRLIHAYFDINLDIVWKTVTEDLPPLIQNLEKILS